MARVFYARTRDSGGVEGWQRLEDHLRQVSELAREFGRAFGGEEWGALVGLWHDLGKYRPCFQDYLLQQAASPDHSTIGALLVQKRFGDRACLVPALIIAGHHGGLTNPHSRKESSRAPLAERLKKKASLLDEALEHAPEEIVSHPLPGPPALPQLSSAARGDRQRRMELWTRFLFSALVDADRLDSERFADPTGFEARGRFANIAELRGRLDDHVDRLAAGAKLSAVNRLRGEVLNACRQAAEAEPGLFSLSVPTGGGKTLAAMSFALRHAARHGLRRVLVAIPFTSIIDQTAAVYRKALGDDQVVEHHSALDPEKETAKNRLASENWDAPVIVTTNVQLFESLFADRASRCRKLHNVAGSVILLDEPQALPIEFLDPILDALRELVEVYGCSVVLSTATQPAFARREGFPIGLEGVREIVAEPAVMAGRLRRYRVRWPQADAGPTEWPELAAEVEELDQALVVVHRRADAAELARLLPEEGRFHLSALMCGAHRKEVLQRVRWALKKGRTCRLVSTQLIEAGVDVDFPIVYRALGGLDSLVQAAGRCNREGRLDLGEMRVFRALTAPPLGTPKKGLEATEALLALHGGDLDMSDPALYEEYFRRLYLVGETDNYGIQPERAGFNFATVGTRFRLIPDYTEPVAVPFGEAGRRAIARFSRPEPNRWDLRRLQPFIVQVPNRVIGGLAEAGDVSLVHERVWVIRELGEHLYDPELGLQIDLEGKPIPPSRLMVSS